MAPRMTHPGRGRPVAVVSTDTVWTRVRLILGAPRSRTLLGVALLVLAMFGAFGDGTTGAVGRADLVLADPAPVITSLDTTVGLVARAHGTIVDPASLSVTLTTEARYVADRPVLDPARLEAGRLVVRAPGEATLRVTAPHARPTTVRITVAPTGPLVLNSVVPAGFGPDSVVTLHGYRLDDPAVLATVAGAAARTVARDSATYAFRPAPIDTTLAACAAPGRAAVEVTGAALRDGLTLPGLRVERAGELAVAPGEVVYLTRQQMKSCVMVPAPDANTGARYTFVTVDTAWTVPGVEWATPYASGPAPLSVARLSPSPSSGPGPAEEEKRFASLPFRTQVAARLAGQPIEVASPTPGPTTHGFEYMYADAPLAVADTFTTVGTDLGAVRPARPATVLDVVGGYVVVAAWADLGEEELVALRASLPMMRQAIERFLDGADAVYQDAFGVDRPRTLEHHEQVVLMVETRPGSATARRLMSIPIGNGLRTDIEGFYATFAHELAHLYHFAYRHERATGRLAGPQGDGDAPRSTLWRAWNVEGVADYMAAHAGAAFRGLAHPPADWAPTLGDQIYRGVSGGGAWSTGYAAMGGLLRQFESALVAAGTTPAEARRRVVRAAMTGWGPSVADHPAAGACGLRCLLTDTYGSTSIGNFLLRAYLDDLAHGARDGESRDGRTWQGTVQEWGAGGNVTVLDVDGGAYRLEDGRKNDSELWAVIRAPDGDLPHR